MFNTNSRKKYIHIALLLLWLMIIFHFSAQPAEESSELSGGILTQLMQMFRDVPAIGTLLKQEWAETLIRKAAHFLEYVVLGMLLFVMVRDYAFSLKNIAIISWLLGVGYAVTDELHQLFVPGRSCQISDILIDAAGVFVGVLLIFVYFCLEYIREKSYTVK